MNTQEEIYKLVLFHQNKSQFITRKMNDPFQIEPWNEKSRFTITTYMRVSTANIPDWNFIFYYIYLIWKL